MARARPLALVGPVSGADDDTEAASPTIETLK
jgi:hypothetical protein